MVAQKNVAIDRAVSGIYQLTEEEMIREQCRQREEFHLRQKMEKQRLDRMHDRLAEAESALAEKMSELTETKSELTETKDRLTETEGELTETKGRLTGMEKDLQRALDEIEQLKVRLGEMQGSILR